MARTKLRASTTALAIRLQEAMDSGDSLSAGDIRKRLSDAVSDMYRDTGHWGYYQDHFGDAESGDVIYSCDGDMMRAPYEITGGATGETSKCIINTDDAEDVVPRTVYEVEQDEADHLASMESLRTEKLYRDVVPVYERFIAKSTRDNANASDFAGKGKSFPILKAEDVAAAASSLGRAGSGNYDTATIKANIIRIAKRKGFPLPKAWQKADSKESAVAELLDVPSITAKLKEAGARHSASDLADIQKIHDTTNSLGATCPDTFRMTGTESAITGPVDLRVTESACETEEIHVQEAAKPDYEIKLIAPGKGAMAYYPADVLKRDGAVAFPAETKVYLNHQTPAQEAAEGGGNRDVTRLVGVLTKPAEWKESHPKGPGLYSRVKVFSDHAQAMDEKHPYLAMSINANARQAVEAGRKLLKEGLPLLSELLPGKDTSVDVVPVAGAGGLIVQESARAAEKNQLEVGMDADELKALKESNARLMERAIFQDATITAHRLLSDVSLHESAKRMVIENVIGVEGAWRYIPRKDGSLDTPKFTEMINSETKRIGRMLSEASGGGRPFGMGVSAYADQPKAEDIALREAARKVEETSAIESFTLLMGDGEAAKLAAKGRAA
jgi:hypothetical protein